VCRLHGAPTAQYRGRHRGLSRRGGRHGPDRTADKQQLRTPRAAAIAGILFSGLLIAMLLLFLSVVPKDALGQGAWGASDRAALGAAPTGQNSGSASVVVSHSMGDNKGMRARDTSLSKKFEPPPPGHQIDGNGIGRLHRWMIAVTGLRPPRRRAVPT
jgi:hypothetical protein